MYAQCQGSDVMKETYTALREFGAVFLGPALSVYLRAVEKQAAGKLSVCLAREGWLIHRLVEHLRQEGLMRLAHGPVYLQVSRTLLFRATLGEQMPGDAALQMDFQGTVRELLMKRFGLQMHEADDCLPREILDLGLTLPDQAEEVGQWLSPYAARLQQRVAPTRSAVYHYFEEQGLCGELTPLMLDVGYSGTIQKLCTHLVGRETDGLYFIANNAGKQRVGNQNINMAGVFRENVGWQENYTMLERSLFLECMMTAPHGQVVDIQQTRQGDYLFFHGREASSQRYYQNLEAVFEGAKGAVTEAFRHGITYSVEEVEALYEVFTTQPGAIPQAVRHLFTADDDITGNGMANPFHIFGI